MIPYRITFSKHRIFEDAAAMIDDEMQTELRIAAMETLNVLQQFTPRGISAGGGGLRGSYFIEMRGEPGSRSADIGTSLVYADPVEVGRQPGRRPPLGAIRLWVQRRLGYSGTALNSVSFLIARKIGRVGFAGFFMFRRTAEKMWPIIDQRFDALAERISKRLEEK